VIFLLKLRENLQDFCNNLKVETSVMEKEVSFQSEKMEKQQNGVMEKQKSFRIVMERQVSFSIEKKRDKESPGKRGDAPLHLAARAGNLGKVKEIIQKFDNSKGVKELLSLQNQQGETALYIAAENGHTLVVVEILKHLDLQVASLVANNGYDAFHVAAKQGHLGKFQLII